MAGLACALVRISVSSSWCARALQPLYSCMVSDGAIAQRTREHFQRRPNVVMISVAVGFFPDTATIGIRGCQSAANSIIVPARM